MFLQGTEKRWETCDLALRNWLRNDLRSEWSMTGDGAAFHPVAFPEQQIGSAAPEPTGRIE